MTDKFIGSFNKSRNLIEWQELNTKYDWNIVFDDKKYSEVSKHIIDTIGNKNVYDIKDVVKYFRTAFYAFETNICYFYDYMCDFLPCRTQEDVKRYALPRDSQIEALADEIGKNYSYIVNDDGVPSTEKSITIVIPISYRKELQEKYSFLVDEWDQAIDRHRKWCQENNMQMRLGGVYENILIVVGSFDGTTINSMKVLLQNGMIPDVEYALEFFRLHS